jgi:antitoxin component YwqK of YwqJK toxin-antitoxin module
MKTETRKYYWNDGNLGSEREYLNGIPHGIQLSFHGNGKKFRKYHEFYGVKNGVWEEWWSDGTRYFIQQEKNNIINGIEIIFNY